MEGFSSPNIGKLAEALAKAQAEMLPAVKDKKNPFFKSNYADLSSVWDSIRKPLTNNGLSIVQLTKLAESGTVLSTVLAHSSGEWVRSDYPITAVKNDPQGLGSAVTYARRYALAAMVGVCTEDDDGEAASRPQNPIDEKYQKINSAADARKAAESAPVDWDDFPFRYRLPEKRSNWNMKQVENDLSKIGARKNPENGCWYSKRELRQLSEFVEVDSRQNDIPFVGEV